MRRLLLIALLALSLGGAARADDRFGVVYTAGPDQASRVDADFQAMATMGLGWVRILPDWSLQEPSRGQWDWTWSDTLVKAARAHGLKLVYTLGYTPHWASVYASENDPEVWAHNRPADVKTWQAYVAAVAHRYGRDISVWQVWERPDIWHFRGNDQDLKGLLVAADRTIHAVSPDARVIGPETGDVNLGSIDRMYRHGLAEVFDILGLYPDRNPPDAVVRPLDTLESRIVSRKGPLRTVWMDGVDWNVQTPPGSSLVPVVDEAHQASDLVESTVLALAHGVSTVLWGAWRDRTDGMAAVQTCSGLESALREPRPAMAAYRTLIEHLRNRTFKRTLDWGAGRTAVEFDGAGTPLVVAWSDTPVAVSLPPGVTVDGTPAAQAHLGPTPVYLEGDVTHVQVPAAAPAPDFSDAADVHVTLAARPVAAGLYVRSLPPRVDERGGQPCWCTDLANQKSELLFDIDDSFLYFVDGRWQVDVDVEVWGNEGTLPVGFNVAYDGVEGYSFTAWQWVDAGPGWKHYVFHIKDAVMADPRSDFRINALGSKGDLCVRSVTVRKVANR